MRNGDFETKNQDAQGLNNIAPESVFDDLPHWFNVSRTPDYVTSTTTVLRVNTQHNTSATNPPYAPFLPHNGSNGCVQLAADFGVSTLSYEYVGQKLTGLSLDHQYRAEFYVLRRPTAPVKARICFTVHDAPPTRITTTLSPAPTSTITSGYITDVDNWTKVSGTFTAHATEQWIVIGYEQVPMVQDNFIPFQPNADGGSGPAIHIIDDVSVTDEGCAAPPLANFPMTVLTDNAQPVHEWDLLCAPLALNASVPNVPGVTYTWSINSGSLLPGDYTETISQNTYRVQVNKPYYHNDPHPLFDIVCQVENSCGGYVFSRLNNIQTRGSLGAGSPCAGGGEPVERSAGTEAYPNPASTEVVLPKGTEDVRVRNAYGKAVDHRQGKSLQRLQISALPDGLYHLDLIVNGKHVSQRIRIQH